jgi:hypothetical protein
MVTTKKTITMNAFGTRGTIIRDPTWLLWTHNAKGMPSERYGDGRPISNTTDMDFAIEWINGGYKHSKGDGQFKGYVLYQLHKPSKRLFRHTYKAKGEVALEEKKGTKWVFVD